MGLEDEKRELQKKALLQTLMVIEDSGNFPFEELDMIIDAVENPEEILGI